MINWRKGLFRFWIVIFAFWIISIVVLNIDSYNQASKKESRLKHIVSETKNPKKALEKIIEELPELRQKYEVNLFDPPGEWEVVDSKPFDPSLYTIKPPKQLSKDDLKKLSDEELLQKVKKQNEFIQGALINICKQTEKNKQNNLYNILLLSFIPPIILLIIGSAIFWALRGFRT